MHVHTHTHTQCHTHTKEIKRHRPTDIRGGHRIRRRQDMQTEFQECNISTIAHKYTYIYTKTEI